MSTIEKLWNAVSDLGEGIHRFGTKDISTSQPVGLYIWNLIKPNFSTSTNEYTWNPTFLTIKESSYREVDSNRHMLFGSILDNREEISHFLIQHFRIANRKPCTLTTVMQIAFNIGQLKQHFNKPHIAPFASTYYKHKLNAISTYVDEATVTELNAQVSQSNVDNINKVIDQHIVKPPTVGTVTEGDSVASAIESSIVTVEVPATIQTPGKMCGGKRKKKKRYNYTEALTESSKFTKLTESTTASDASSDNGYNRDDDKYYHKYSFYKKKYLKLKKELFF